MDMEQTFGTKQNTGLVDMAISKFFCTDPDIINKLA